MILFLVTYVSGKTMMIWAEQIEYALGYAVRFSASRDDVATVQACEEPENGAPLSWAAATYRRSILS